MDERKKNSMESEDIQTLFRFLDELESRNRRLEQVEEAMPPEYARKVKTEDLLSFTPEEADPEAGRLLEERTLFPEDLGDLLIDPYEVETTDLESDEEAQLVEEEEEPVPEEDVDDLPPPPERVSPLAALWDWVRANLPEKGDGAGTVVRKCVFWLALLVVIVSLLYIVIDVCIIPLRNDRLYTGLEDLYEPDISTVVQEGTYPEGMLTSFKGLYDRNAEVRGWLSYHSTGNRDFLDIDYPVMYSGDNEKYLTLDFDQKKNKNGALFFDENNRLNAVTDENRSLIIYGHNMASGQMFAGLNKLIGNVNHARTSASLTLSTLFEKSEYRVFAVLMTDEEETSTWYFNTRRTRFASDDDFLGFVQRLRDRSLFDYPVDVAAEDELVVLSTCTAKSTSKLNNGRLIVVARKVRQGEGSLDTSLIQRNEDVIMPRAWYLNQGLALHAYYGGDHSGMTTTTKRPTSTTTAGSSADGTTDTSDSGMTDPSGSTTSGTDTTGTREPSGHTGTTTDSRRPSGSTTGSTTKAPGGGTTVPTSGTTAPTEDTTPSSSEPSEDTSSTETTSSTEPAEPTGEPTESTTQPAETTTSTEATPTTGATDTPEPPAEGGDEPVDEEGTV